jgi:pimeloyl-ACP methyl ester carboxylesterase
MDANATPHFVLLPGLGGTGELFTPLTRHIDGRAVCEIVSYPLDRFLNYGELAEFVRGHLPADRPFAILAESFSGPIAIAIAANPPPNLRAVILCCTFASFPNGLLRSLGTILPFLPASRPPVAAMEPLLMGRWRAPNLSASLPNALSRVHASILRRRALEALRADYRVLASSLAVPTLCLAATHDRIVPNRACEDLQACIPKARAAIVVGPHFLLQCNPAGAWLEIERFLAPPA